MNFWLCKIATAFGRKSPVWRVWLDPRPNLSIALIKPFSTEAQYIISWNTSMLNGKLRPTKFSSSNNVLKKLIIISYIVFYYAIVTCMQSINKCICHESCFKSFKFWDCKAWNIKIWPLGPGSKVTLPLFSKWPATILRLVNTFGHTLLNDFVHH